jgi:TfoX/Sxy family transcriptional regulator of competence genes
VLFDEDGSVAAELAKALRERGAIRVRALFGGLELYAFALDPEVVGAETYLDAIR